MVPSAPCESFSLLLELSSSSQRKQKYVGSWTKSNTTVHLSREGLIVCTISGQLITVGKANLMIIAACISHHHFQKSNQTTSYVNILSSESINTFRGSGI